MYTRFGDNDIVTRQAAELVTSTWTDNQNNLTTSHTASEGHHQHPSYATPTSSGQFFIQVFNANSASVTSEIQYSVAFGNRNGSGSPDFTNDTGSFGLGASRVIYNQYRQLHFNDDSKNFTFGQHTPDSIFVININRARYKQRLTLGSLNINISASTAGANDSNTVHLTDDSVTRGGVPVDTSVSLGPYYNIVSGTSGVVLSGTTAGEQVSSGSNTNQGYGFFYPQAGLLIFNADAFSQSINHHDGNLNPGGPTENTDRNHLKFFQAISNSGHFIVDTTEEVNSQFYFCRAQNKQFNYTNNDSFVDGTNKAIRFETMKMNPKVFITTVGLYNDAFELLAVAKLSQPVAKDFTKEALIRVKLDF